jgi:hypothetical protein
MDPVPFVDPQCSINIIVWTDPFNVYHVLARTRKFLFYSTARIRTFPKPGAVRALKNTIRIRMCGYVSIKIFRTRGSGSADPDVRIAINPLMTCGSGSADPDVRIIIKFL